MKNIHVLPTNKPSRLSINCETDLLQLGLDNRMFHDDMHIYITSDEEIGTDEYYFHLKNNEYYNSGRIEELDKDMKFWKKIILTTDQNLIKDGVQAIPDEFLEWFVKNPSCEEIEVQKGLFNSNGKKVDIIDAWKYYSTCVWYKIIIPKEESKQGTMSEAIKQVIKNQLNQIEELKQETLEEFIQKQLSLGKYQDQESAIRHSIELGAKWQQEQDKNKYSEEDLISLLEFNYKKETNQLGTLRKDYSQKIVKEWFEQFKKK